MPIFLAKMTQYITILILLISVSQLSHAATPHSNDNRVEQGNRLMEQSSYKQAYEKFIQAIDNGRNTESALETVLRTQKNLSRESFDQLVSAAIKHGLTSEQADNIVNRLKESGVCK